MNKIILKSAATLLTVLVLAPSISTVVSADTANYNTSGDVEFVTGDSGTTPVDPEKPVDPVTPENPDPTDPVEPPVEVTKGLSLDFASTLAFGQQKISSADENYYAHAQKMTDKDGNATYGPDYVQVTDVRGTFAGWTLTVATDGQFRMQGTDMNTTPEPGAPLGTYLTGAELKFTGGAANGVVTAATPSNVTSSMTLGIASQTVMSAKANEGIGTWTYALGSKADYDGAALDKDAVATKSPITLNIPGSTAKKAASYTANLIWTLSDTPGN